MPSVTRRTQSSRAARRDEVRNRLLEVVEQLIAEGESFTEISVERIVSAAGMSRSTFYVYFEDKGDLLRAWFAAIEDDLAATAKAWWDLGGAATREDVRAALARIVHVYRPHVPLTAAMFDAAAYDANVRDITDGLINFNSAGLRKHIRTGQKGGFIDPELPPAQTSAWLTAMAERGFHRLVRGASDAEVEKLIDAYAAIIWNSLYAPTR